MRDRDWAPVAVLLESFPGDFPPRAAQAYRAMLEGTLTAEECLLGLKRYVATGERWRPGPGEIVALAGRAVTLPPFGAVREELGRVARSTPVRLARTPHSVTAAFLAGVPEGVVAEYVTLVGGERIRRAALYLSDDLAERTWQGLERDYEKLTPTLVDRASLNTPERRTLQR